MAQYVTREQLEARIDAIQTRYETFARRVFRAFAFYTVALLLTAAAAGYGLKQNIDQTNEIKANLVESCQTNGDPLREAGAKFGEVLAHQKQVEIAQSKAFENSGLYARAFNLKEPELHALLEEGRERAAAEGAELEEATSALHPVNCHKQYAR